MLFATPLLKQHQVVSNEEAWCLFTKRSYAFPWSKHINIRLSAVAASWHKLRLALAYRGAAMPSRNAWLLYDSLCASKLLYCSAIWWPGPGNQVATKAYTKQIGDHFRGVMKFITGSHADQDAVCFEHHHMSLADRLNTHLLNTRIRWATQAQSRTSSIVARASPRLKRIVCNLDSLYSTVSHNS